jgi:hypothetical protein
MGFLIASLHAAGLIVLSHTPSLIGFLRELLGRPRNETLFVMLPVGYPADDCRVPVLTFRGRGAPRIWQRRYRGAAARVVRCGHAEYCL